MTPEVSLEEFVRIAEKSRLLEGKAIALAAAKATPNTARGLADSLVKAGDLTHFQAEKLLRGHWRGLAIGPYRILAPLARGGMGTVYLAQDSRLAAELGDEILVALKVLPPRAVEREVRMLDRFQRELELGQRVSHPNVVKTLGGGKADGVNFIAMEYVPGKTLRQIVEEYGRMAVGDAARIGADVALGLAHLHDRGVIHRDLKPSNVMVASGGHAKILDLGLAVVPKDSEGSDPSTFGGKNYIVGTMDYISPEQARDANDVTPRSDLYALGCTLYYAVTGTPPFPGGSSKDKIRWQRTIEPAPLLELNPLIPGDFARIVEALMAKEPQGRPPSALATRELLRSWATAPISSTNVSTHDAVEAADRPDAHPQLWEVVSESDSEEVSEEVASAESYPPWVLALGIAFCFLAFIIVVSLLRRL